MANRCIILDRLGYFQKFRCLENSNRGPSPVCTYVSNFIRVMGLLMLKIYLDPCHTHGQTAYLHKITRVHKCLQDWVHREETITSYIFIRICKYCDAKRVIFSLSYMDYCVSESVSQFL